MYLLRHYLRANDGTQGSRTVLVLLSYALLIGALNAWVAPELGFWFTTSFAALGILSTPQRPTAFEAYLPISGRDLAIARLVSSFGLSLIPLLMTALVIEVRSPAKFDSSRLLQCVALLALGNLLPRLVRPKEFKPDSGETLYVLAALAVIAATLIYFTPTIASSSVLVASAAVAGMIWWRVTPEAFQAASEQSSSRTSRAVMGPSDPAGGWMLIWRMVCRTLYSKHRLFNLLMITLAGATGQWMLALIVFFGVDDLWRNSNWTRALPFSNRARLGMILLPGVGVPFAFLLLGMQLNISPFMYSNSLRRSAILTGSEEHYYSSPTEISFEHWKRASGDTVPVLMAPWGETARPYTVRLLGSTYYNPYTVRERSSEAFGEWQFSRLTKAVYGIAMTREGYKALPRAPRRITNQWRMMILSVAASVTGIFLLLVLMGISKFVGTQPKSASFGVGVALATSVLTMVPILYGALATESTDAVFALAQSHLMRLSDALPASNLIVLLVALIPVAAMYALLEWQFARSEFVPLKTARK